MKRVFAWFLVLAMLLSGCGAGTAEEKPAETTAAVETTAATEPTTEPTTAPTEPPVYRNPLNGEILEEPYTGRIFAHTITNTQDALPHVNAVKADILVEAYVSRGVVRCLGLYTNIAEVEAMNRRMGIPEKFDFIRDEDIEQMITWAMKEANPVYPVPQVYTRDHFRQVIQQIRA